MLSSRRAGFGGTFIDIGANVGIFSLIASKIYNHVFSFEPLQSTALVLRENLNANNATNVAVFECALSNCVGKSLLHINPLNNGGHSLIAFQDSTIKKSGVTGWRKEVVPLNTLDCALSSICVGDIHLIKIDVEGHEVEVIGGASEVILLHKPMIFAEVSGSRKKIESMLNALPCPYIVYGLSGNGYRIGISNMFIPHDVLFVPLDKPSLIDSLEFQ